MKNTHTYNLSLLVTDFQLISDFKPTGDQPLAIERLSGGVKSGLKHQTLLGVTGSGKSVVASTPILIRRGAHLTCEPIGPFIDRLLSERSGQLGYVGDTEVLESDALDTAIEVFSFDPATGESSWKPVRQFLRHQSPKALWNVKTACGRCVTVTGDHNFFVLRDGQLRLVRTEDIRPSDYLPLPREMPEPAEPIVELALDEQLEPADRVYVSLSGFAEHWAMHQTSLRPVLSSRQAYGMLQLRERVSLEKYRQLVTVVPALATGVSFGTIKRRYTSPGRVPLTPALLRLLGYYVAEGHAESQYFVVSSAEEEVVSELGNATGELTHINWCFHEIEDTKLGSPLTVLGQRCGGNDDHASARSA